jgi:outer membrane protein TolC
VKLFLKLFMWVLLVSSPAMSQETAHETAQKTLSLAQFLQQATIQAEDFQAFEKSLKSLEYEIQARDLELSSNLKLEANDLKDQKDSFSNFLNRDTRSQVFGVTLTKPFATGTTASLGTAYELAEQDSSGNKLYRSNWDLSLTQDLWKNAFGKSTRLRRQSDQMELENRKLDLLLQRQQLVNNLEALYWDLALDERERAIREDNLKRSQQILDWTQKRLRISAARDTDLLQAQALVSTRKLELADVERSAVSNRARLQQLIPGLANASWKPDLSELEKDRNIRSLLVGDRNRDQNRTETPTLISALSAQYKTQQLQVEAQAVKDNLNPTLQVQLAHGQNGIRPDSSEAVDRSLARRADSNRIGLLLSMDLDFDLKNKSREAAELAAQSAQLQAKRLERSSQVGWMDLSSEIEYLKNSLKLSKELYDFQRKKIEGERRYFQQGRSTVFEFINFEVVAADAELRFFRLLNQMRKTESGARLFSLDPKASFQ